MAGGRRPASYVSGARHNAGGDRVSSPVYPGNAVTRDSMINAFPETEPPYVNPARTESVLPPWIPSIWQPIAEKSYTTAPLPASTFGVSSATPLTHATPPVCLPLPSTHVSQTAHHTPTPQECTSGIANMDRASALTSALNSAVQAAVLRVLSDSCGNVDGRNNHQKFSNSKKDLGADESSSVDTFSNVSAFEQQSGSARGTFCTPALSSRELNSLRIRSDEHDTNLQSIQSRMEKLESNMSSERDNLQQLHALVSNASAQIASLSVATSDDRRAIDARLSDMTAATENADDKLHKLQSICDNALKTAQETKERTDALHVDFQNLRKEFDDASFLARSADSHLTSVEWSVSSLTQQLTELLENRKNCSNSNDMGNKGTSPTGPYECSAISSEDYPISCQNVDRRVDSVSNLDKTYKMDGNDRGSDNEGGDSDVRRAVEETIDSVSSLKSRMKRVEGHMAEVDKQLNEATALNTGFEDVIRNTVEEIQNKVTALSNALQDLKAGDSAVGSTCAVIREAKTGRDNGCCAANGRSHGNGGGGKGVGGGNGKKCNASAKCGRELDLDQRMSLLEGQLQSLKRLIESNLRNQMSAEGIVKDQVSLITKHVCMAVRQYTARQISENNTLIDQTLRARIPEYAKGHDQFVLIRGENAGDTTDSVDIQQAGMTNTNMGELTGIAKTAAVVASKANK